MCIIEWKWNGSEEITLLHFHRSNLPHHIYKKNTDTDTHKETVHLSKEILKDNGNWGGRKWLSLYMWSHRQPNILQLIFFLIAPIIFSKHQLNKSLCVCVAPLVCTHLSHLPIYAHSPIATLTHPFFLFDLSTYIYLLPHLSSFYLFLCVPASLLANNFICITTMGTASILLSSPSSKSRSNSQSLPIVATTTTTTPSTGFNSPLLCTPSSSSHHNLKTSLSHLSASSSSSLPSSSLSSSSSSSSCFIVTRTKPELDTPPQLANQPWVRSLLSTRFYGACDTHSTFRKNERNIFCKTHAIKICSYCQTNSHSHANCTVLHVTRYMYHDVLLTSEVSAVLNIVSIQPYVNNGHRVVYIDRRAQALSNAPPNAKTCIVCDRTLQEPYKFCCIYCKLRHENHPAATRDLPVPNTRRLYNPPCTTSKQEQEQQQGGRSTTENVVVGGRKMGSDSHYGKTRQQEDRKCCQDSKKKSKAKKKKSKEKQSSCQSQLNQRQVSKHIQPRTTATSLSTLKLVDIIDKINQTQTQTQTQTRIQCQSKGTENNEMENKIENGNGNGMNKVRCINDTSPLALTQSNDRKRSHAEFVHHHHHNKNNNNKAEDHEEEDVESFRKECAREHDAQVQLDERRCKRRRKGIPVRSLLSMFNGSIASE